MANNTTTDKHETTTDKPKANEKVQVLNEDARIYSLPVSSDGGRRVKLIPGLNFVDPKDWAIVLADARKNPDELVGFLLRDGRIKEFGEGAASLAEMPVAKARELVKMTLNRKLLREWADDEDRPTIKKALAAQLNELDGGAKSAA